MITYSYKPDIYIKLTNSQLISQTNPKLIAARQPLSPSTTLNLSIG